jgi:hypothetical protein
MTGSLDGDAALEQRPGRVLLCKTEMWRPQGHRIPVRALTLESDQFGMQVLLLC